jgi:glycosyltransferase involved in cell wall biosynthesis
LTKAYAVGGHTRVVSRWIEADPARRHVVCLTQQEGDPVPDDLAQAASRSGGLRVLDEDSPSLVRLVRRLQGAADDADMVILHIHPFDVVPSLAFANWPDRPPVGFFNHADHVFWLGRSVSDIVICFRRSGAQLAVSRRGVPKDQVVHLALPMVPHAAGPVISRDEARQQLGISADTKLLLTMASAIKYEPVEGADYCILHAPLLDQFPKVQIMAIGPSPELAYWKDWKARSGNRIQALGIIPDPRAHLAAADVYLDSTSFGSLTSLLDAARAGLPVLSWRSPERQRFAEILSSDDPALDDLDVMFTDADLYRERISQLISNPELRQREAETVLRSVTAVHMGDSWSDRLLSLYDSLSVAAGRRPFQTLPEAGPGPLDDLLLALQATAPFDQSDVMPHYYRFSRIRSVMQMSGLQRRPPYVSPVPTSRLALLKGAVRDLSDAVFLR